MPDVLNRGAVAEQRPCLVEYRKRVPWVLFSVLAATAVLVFGGLWGGLSLERALPGLLGNLVGLLFIGLCCYLLIRMWAWWFKGGRRRLPYPAAEAVLGFIVSNGLYEAEDDGKGGERIKSSARFEVFEDEDFITVAAIKQQGRWFEAGAYGEKLAALFGLPVDEVTDGINSVVYRFRKSAEKRLIVSAADFATLNPASTSVIPLMSETSWDMTKTPHCLVSGATGGGKSVFINYLIMRVLQDRGQVFVCDPKRSDLYGALRPILGADCVGSTGGEVAKIARLVSDAMEERYRFMQTEFRMGSDYRDHPEIAYPVLWVLDEMAAAWAGMDRKTREETEKRLVNVVMKGRQCGVFVLIATQQPRSDTIKTDVRDQMGARFSLGSLSREGYSMCYGSAASDFEFKPRDGQGVGYFFLDDGNMQQPRPFDAPFVDFAAIDFPATAKRLYEANPRNRAQAAELVAVQD